MTNGTYTGQTDWRVGGVSKAYRSEVIPLSFEGRNKDVDRRKIGLPFQHHARDGQRLSADCR